jgi:hypothetical protein
MSLGRGRNAPDAALETLDGHGPAVFQAAAPRIAHLTGVPVEDLFSGEDLHDLQSFAFEHNGPGRFVAFITGVTLDPDLFDSRFHGDISHPLYHPGGNAGLPSKRWPAKRKNMVEYAGNKIRTPRRCILEKNPGP